MSIPINQDTSTQPTLTFTTVSTPETLNIWQRSGTNIYNTDIGNVGIGTTTNINFKLKVNGIVNATAFNGDGANITSVPFSTITGKPTSYQADWTSTIINKPSTFPADMTNIYTKTETNNLLSAKDAVLTFTSPLIRTTNTISFSESAITTLTNFYNKTDADARYLQLSGGTLTGNLNVNANITTQQLYINNQNSTASIIFSPNPSIYSIFSRKVPWAMYFAEDYNPASPTVLPNYISNSRDAELTGTIAKTTEAGNGATGNITYISGGTGATISFPAGSIPSTFTILSLTRYNGINKQRILDGSTPPSYYWLHGHWRGDSGSAKRGKAYYNTWITNSSSSEGNIDDWLCMIGKNIGGLSGGNILVDGIPKATTTGGAGGNNYRLNINIGITNEKSDWALSCVMIWDTALTDAEMLDLNTIINTYKNDGVSIKSLISSTIDDDSIIENRVYNGLEKTELLLFKGNDATGTNGVDRIRLKAGNIAFDTYSSLTHSSSRNNENIVMLINENGNVGIGTTTNLTSKLNINGSLNATSFSGDGANITSVPYSTITGKPSTFPADMTNIYTKNETDNLLTNKDAVLTFTSPLVRSTNTITFNESSITTLTNFYNKNDADNRYLKLSGGSLTGNVYGNDILLSVNKGSFKRIDTLGTINVNVPGVGDEGPLTGGEKILLGAGTPTTHPYSIGLNTNVQWYSVPTGATQIFYIGGTAITTISSTGLTTTGIINATTNLQENGTNLTSKYLRLSGGTMTGDLNISDQTGVNSSTFTRMVNIVGTQARLVCWSSSTSATSGIELISAPTNGSTVPTTFTSRWDLNCGNSTTGDFLFIRQRTTGTTNTYFVIGSTGSVGIGTTVNTLYKLNVDGALNSTSLYNNGTLINFSSYATNTDLTTNYYNKTTTNSLLDAKDAILSFSSPLVRTTNTISFNESSITTLTNFYNKTNSDDRYLRLSGGTLTGNLTLNTDNTVLSFGSRIDNYLIKLWGNEYGFGINSGMLRYNSDGIHTFYCAGTQIANISSTGLSIGKVSTNLTLSSQVRSPLLTATQNSTGYTSGIYGSSFNGWYIDLNTFWSSNAGNGGPAYLTLCFCFSQNTNIKWYGRVLVNSGGGTFSVITDLKNPTSGGTMFNVSGEWGTGGQNFLYISQSVMDTSYTLIYKIIG